MSGDQTGSVYQARDEAGADLAMTLDESGLVLSIEPIDAYPARCRLEEEQLRELQSWLSAHGRDLATDAEVAAVPVATVLRAVDGTIAARYDSTRGVVFGDERPFPWDVLSAPATVLWSIADQARAQPRAGATGSGPGPDTP